MSTPIEWSDAAVDDVESVLDYLEADAIDSGSAEKLLNAIDRALTSLPKTPQRGRIVPELRAIGVTSYRELIIQKHYRLIYRIKQKAIVIVVFADGRRDLESLVLERATRAKL